ncbi:MAG TPA: hypothetical protein VFZ83_01115 [Acidimicrobiia bacterium]|nr:hypothetical protein [Acidimicrobiia bacterium]
MPEFLTEAWIASFDAAARQSRALADIGAARAIVIEHVVRNVHLTGAAAPIDVAYRLTCDADGARVAPVSADPAPDTSAAPATVRIECDHVTAVALARGTVNAQAALARGTWRISGDVGALGVHANALAGLGDLLAELRAATEFPEPAP